MLPWLLTVRFLPRVVGGASQIDRLLFTRPLQRAGPVDVLGPNRPFASWLSAAALLLHPSHSSTLQHFRRVKVGIAGHSCRSRSWRERQLRSKSQFGSDCANDAGMDTRPIGPDRICADGVVVFLFQYFFACGFA